MCQFESLTFYSVSFLLLPIFHIFSSSVLYSYACRVLSLPSQVIIRLNTYDSELCSIPFDERSWPSVWVYAGEVTLRVWRWMKGGCITKYKLIEIISDWLFGFVHCPLPMQFDEEKKRKLIELSIPYTSNHLQQQHFLKLI